MIKSRQRFFNTMRVIADSLIISLSLFLSWFIRFNTSIFEKSQWHLDFNTYMMPLVVILPLYIFLYDIVGLYKPQRLKGIIDDIASIVKANMIGIFLLVAVLFIVKEIHYSRWVLILFAVFCTFFTIAERIIARILLRSARSRGYNLQHILVVGAGDSACNFSNKIKMHKYLGYNIIGYLDDEKKLGYKINDVPVIGRISDLADVIQKNDLDEVIIAISIKEYDRLNELIRICEKYGVKAQIIPDYYKYIPAKPYVDEIDGIPLINIRYVPLDDAYKKFIKRFMDIVLSLIGIILASPIMIFCAIMIKLTSKGPIIFKQERVGMHRRNFMMYKFRSMKVQDDEEEKIKWTTKDDPRKTKFGEFMRKTSIDELPQLFNVLKGDMSLIGPRPERPYFVEKFREEIPKYMVKHHVRPGITGWAQVNGFRGDTSIKKRIDYDIYYIENWTIWLDLKIIILTIFKGFINKNAY